MEYTQKDYEEDQRISNWVFNKYFKKDYRFKDDLIQESLIRLWKNRAKFNEAKCKYSTWAVKVSITSMLMFFRKEKKYYNNLSLDYEFKRDDGDKMNFAEFIGINEIDTDKIDVKILFENVLKNKNEEERIIVDRMLKGFTQKEIAKEIGKSRASVSRKVSKFGNELKIEMVR